jgi:hypothetical protein
MRPQQAVADPLGPASVSRLYLVGTTDARSDSNRGVDACRLFDIVGLDEGTCGRRPGLLEPLGSGWSVKFMPFQRYPPERMLG